MANIKSEIIIRHEELNRIPKEIGELEEKIRCLKNKLKSSTLMLRKLEEELEKKNSIVSNSEIVSAIVVDDERNELLSNGLVDVNRDILMKLIRITRDWQKMRNV
jgi:hypothetical protein